MIIIAPLLLRVFIAVSDADVLAPQFPEISIVVEAFILLLDTKSINSESVILLVHTFIFGRIFILYI